MSIAVGVLESDNGTKESCKRALARTSKELNKNFAKTIKEYWWAVWYTARRLCIEMGAFDTGTLYESIRLIWEYEPTGGMFEIAVSSQGVDMVAMIKVGGGININPKTGKVVDYAQAVHDGTRYMHPRPFLTLAIVECQPILDSLMTQGVDSALMAFMRDY